MKGQTKKGLRLAAWGLAAILAVTLLPASAFAAGSRSCPQQNASDIIRMFSQQGNPFSQKNCTPSDVSNALDNACNNANVGSASDILNALKNGKGVDVNSLYKYLCPTSTPSCPTQPTNPPATPKPTAAPKPTATPKPTAAPEPTDPGSSIATELEVQMVELINAERAKVGASPLRINDEVTEIARLKSQDMIDKNYFSHTSPTYGSPFEMLKSFGVSYRTAGENIAMNRSMTSAHTALMNSEGHRKNILNPAYTSIGLGIVTNASGYLYITQMFIG